MSAFQDKLVDQSDKFYTRVVHQIRDTYGEVTFANFVQFILDQSGRVCRTINRCNLDKHWRPFVSRCGYCDVPYDVIATAENIAEDQKYIGHMANVTFHKIGRYLDNCIYSWVSPEVGGCVIFENINYILRITQPFSLLTPLLAKSDLGGGAGSIWLNPAVTNIWVSRN